MARAFSANALANPDTLDDVHFKIRHADKTDSTIILMVVGMDRQETKRCAPPASCLRRYCILQREQGKKKPFSLVHRKVPIYIFMEEQRGIEDWYQTAARMAERSD
jgi:hypothetical protein